MSIVHSKIWFIVASVIENIGINNYCNNRCLIADRSFWGCDSHRLYRKTMHKSKFESLVDDRTKVEAESNLSGSFSLAVAREMNPSPLDLGDEELFTLLSADKLVKRLQLPNATADLE